MMRLLAFPLLLLGFLSAGAQHPVAFATKSDFELVKTSLSRYPLLQASYADIKRDVDAWLEKDVDVPFPKDPAGGYTHDRHKANYTLMFNSGLLYNLTGDRRYAQLVRNIFLKYAALNPTLKNHPQATSSSPGRLFWQALNDANWLVYTGMAYDLIYNTLSAAERKTIEEGAFKPEVDFVTKDLKDWFNLIHNHGVWACAGVGIVGLATNNKEYVEMALRGTEKNGKSGFLAQLDGLFSPDGYYTEGPYYVRYAILPYYIFANALQKAHPELKIFEYRNRILQKALDAGLQQTNINGVFYPINDAIKEKDFTSNELVTAVDIAGEMYGIQPGYITVAQKQKRVLLSKGGVQLAAAMASAKESKPYYTYKPVEYTDGAKGDEGGVSFLRIGKDESLSTLIFKYASHGLSHGHFDQLGISFFDKGAEVLQDYGSVRYVGIEQKWGGRYLPENKSFAAQTIAHSTLVVDEASHYNGKEGDAEKYHADKLFSDLNGTAVQAVSAKEEHAYPNVQLRRSLYLLQLPQRRILVDLFQTTSASVHQYDLPFQYSGQVIHTSFPYKANGNAQKQLGNKNGYQYLWNEATAKVYDTLTQFTFLTGKGYYTLSSLIHDSAQVLFARTGANDSDFNLRHEPSYIIRTKSSSQTLLNVLEIHGKYDPIGEFSVDSYPAVSNMQLVYDNADYTVAKLKVGKDEVQVIQCNKDFKKESQHNLSNTGLNLKWTGPYAVLLNGKPLK
ncbi:MAG: alginate lyase family protein [Flaviaesturariibacter sp.]|nr:alginate lyase family protein [Flaviaesturariibacter sp.]